MTIKRIVVKSDFPGTIQKEIIKKICQEKKCSNAFVKTFTRHGYSGASLSLIFFSKELVEEPVGVPYLLKIAQKCDIKKEYAAIKIMCDLVTDCRLEIDKKFFQDDWGGLLFLHKGTDQPRNADKVITLSDVLFRNREVYTMDSLKLIINEVYEKLKNAHTGHEPGIVNVSQHFKKYFRGHESKKRIQSVLGSHSNEDYFEFLGTSIYNPLKLIKEIPSRITVYEGHIHGDLHPGNIVLDRNNLPNLVDFAWAESRKDILIDYVLLENSIRFMHFPRIANLDEQLFVDGCLLEEDGYNPILAKNFSNTNIQHLYHRLAQMLEIIRNRAKKHLGDNFTIERYLFVQFIILYGLLRFEEYNQYITTRALGMISERLKDKGLSTLDAKA
jgi:serine/threonine protein kinase